MAHSSDAVSPIEEQIDLFEKFPQPKQFHLVKGKGHLTVLSGDGSEAVIQAQAQFVTNVFNGDARC